MQNNKVVIAGCGIAGIATAVRLAVKGFSVHVYEKNAGPGGKITAFEKQGFHFDAGPSLFTQPSNIEELFELAGEPIEEYFSYEPVDIACRYFYENGKIADAFTDRDLFANELEEKLNEPAENVKKYLSRAGTGYKNIGTVFTEHSLQQSKTWLHRRIGRALRSVKLPYLFSNLHSYNKKQFSSPETVQLFNRFATYNGSNPFKAPAMLSMISSLEHNEGVYYPKGGMISITEALYRLALKKGVEFYFNAPIQQIIYHENKATGVVVNNENIYADVVVSNADAYFTYKNLLGHSGKAKKILKQERSSSAMVFYWGINKKFPSLKLHNIFFSEKYAEEFKHIFDIKKMYNDPTVYINVTSKLEQTKAPPNAENWFVMINLPALTQYDTEEYVAAAKNAVIQKLNRILEEDIEKLIVTEEVLHPQLIEQQTASYSGSLYGTSSNSKLAAFFRHPNFTSYIKNLYFCGGSVHPGGGIPLCLKSAKIVSRIIEQKHKSIRH